MAGKLTVRDLAERGELKPADELRAFWGAFCDADAYPDGFPERMEAAGLIHLRPVDDDDLEEAFAWERGIVPGGWVWSLTEAGRALLAGEQDEGTPEHD